MAYELFNDGPATPNRLHGLLRLVARRPDCPAPQLFHLMQPPSLAENTQNVENVLDVAQALALVDRPDGRLGRVSLVVPQDEFEDITAFRQLMTRRILGVTDVDSKNFVFNLFTGWYATMDDEVLRLSGDRLADSFNQRVYPGAQSQTMNGDKFPAWRTWAAFLGYGWIFVRGSSRILVPDCHDRIAGLIDSWLPADGRTITFSAFIEQMAHDCPELDGGPLFARAVHAGAADQERGRRVSLMLSSALRGLHDAGRCELVELADALDGWSLFPASGHAIQDVTHIRRGGGHRDA